MANRKSELATGHSHKSITAISSVADIIKTNNLFSGEKLNSLSSSIDQFIANTEFINTIYLKLGYEQNPPKIMPELGALAVLGYMSAVEGYFRALIRNLISIDEHVGLLVEPMMISYAAARHHSRSLLPEALTENMSFAGGFTISETLRKIIGITAQLPKEVQVSVSEFEKICEIRHCCVHRFGRLGSKNAINLGFSEHSKLLETPFNPSIEDLQLIGLTLRNFVKCMNNFIFQSLVERIAVSAYSTDSQKAIYKKSWSGNWSSDKVRFTRYYNAFASKNDNPPSPDAKSIYSSLRQFIEEKKKTQKGGTMHPSKLRK